MIDQREHYWQIRSKNYDKLYWTKDASFIDVIIKMADFDADDLVLDVGCGTGIITNAIKPHVKHVIGIDISGAMLAKGKWEGVSLVKSDIADHLFSNKIFDRITARLVFHHILDHLDRAFIRCYDLLKSGGKIIVAEGVPPTDEDDVVYRLTDLANSYMIGDRWVDIEAGKSAGCKTIFIDNEYSECLISKPDFTFSSLAEAAIHILKNKEN